MNSRGQFYEATEMYVNDIIGKYTAPISNIESIRCRHMGAAGDTFIELVHESGTARYFDVTNMDISNIGIMVGYIIAGQPIREEIRDDMAKREVRKLFKH